MFDKTYWKMFSLWTIAFLVGNISGALDSAVGSIFIILGGYLLWYGLFHKWFD